MNMYIQTTNAQGQAGENIAKADNIFKLTPAELDMLNPESLDKVKSFPDWKKKKKLLGLVALISQKFPSQLNEWLENYNLGTDDSGNKGKLRASTIKLLINDPKSRNDFAALVSNLSLDLAENGYFSKKNFSNYDVPDEAFGYVPDGNTYAPEDTKTFFGKLWDSIKEPVTNVFGSLFKPGTEQAAISEADKIALQIEQAKLDQQRQTNNILIYGGIGIAAIIIIAIVLKSSKGSAAPIAAPAAV